ncbi:MAG: asparagine synthase (glutamine-hydrolyzing), partial [Miltoncostaeaceae bacterium]
ILNEDGTIAVTFNGEIYNFMDLRRELVARGHVFRSDGDSEVIVHGYEEWGDDVVVRLDGMFALAIADERHRRTLLARDRTGKKPLYYSTDGGRLTFASEIKALRLAPWVDTSADLTRLPEFMTYGYVPAPHTMFAGVREVPAGCRLVADQSGVGEALPYWDWPTDLAGAATVSAEDLQASLRVLLSRAVERRMVSDVPLGALLSGGVDSSVVVALMSQLADDPIHTFSIGFPDDDSFDERSHARLVADRFGTVHTEFEVSADAMVLLDTLMWHHDQPFHDSSAVPTYLVSKLAREHVTVVLNGDGGDEVFGGYERFSAAAVAGRVPSAGAAVARRLAGLLPRDEGYHSLRRRADRFLDKADRPVEERYQSWISVFDDELLADSLERPAAGDVSEAMGRWYSRAAELPELDRILYANFKTYLPGDLAVKMDRMSMAHGLETRSPFLDTAVVERLARVPARRKVGLRRVKPLLRESCRDLLPDAIWNRRKHGFGVPVGAWFRGPLAKVVHDELLAADARSASAVRPEFVRRVWDEHLRGDHDHGPRLWTLLTLERWLRDLETPQAESPPGAEVVSG